MSRFTDYSDRSNSILWGDGAGAVILSASNKQGILSTHIHADGQHEELLHVPKINLKDNIQQTIEMNGSQVFKIAVNTLDQIVDEALIANNLKKDDIDWLVPHQANIRILEATAKKLEMSMEKVIVTIDRHGNTSAASIPMALEEGIKSHKIMGCLKNCSVMERYVKYLEIEVSNDYTNEMEFTGTTDKCLYEEVIKKQIMSLDANYYRCKTANSQTGVHE